MKLEVGMYVRTENGVIEKVNRICDGHTADNVFVWLHPCRDGRIIIVDDFEEIKFRDLNSGCFVKKEPSFNIIDLLEIGDIITFKNDADVYKIIGVPNEKKACKFFYLAKEFDGGTEDIIVGYEYMKESINSIVTKEEFERVQYKVGE